MSQKLIPNLDLYACTITAQLIQLSSWNYKKDVWKKCIEKRTSSKRASERKDPPVHRRDIISLAESKWCGEWRLKWRAEEERIKQTSLSPTVCLSLSFPLVGSTSQAHLSKPQSGSESERFHRFFSVARNQFAFLFEVNRVASTSSPVSSCYHIVRSAIDSRKDIRFDRIIKEQCAECLAKRALEVTQFQETTTPQYSANLRASEFNYLTITTSARYYYGAVLKLKWCVVF